MPANPIRGRTSGDAGELLDRQARDSYQRRLEDLRDTLAEAESLGDEPPRRSRAARRSSCWAPSCPGRSAWAAASDARAAAAERARVAVQRRVRDAIRRIEEALPEVGRHLQWAVRTGAFCSYRPHGPR